MSKHTPGPWVVYPRVGNLAPGVQRGKEGGFLVEGSTPEREDADARLIAAAPDLLEALVRLAANVGGMKAFEHEVREVVGHTNWSVMQHHLAAADAAIAKATGEQP